MTDQVANFIEVIVSGTYDDAATEITLLTDEGAILPDPSGDNYNLVWYSYSSYPSVVKDPNVEIVRVTAKTDDVITVVRDQEGTGASTKSASGIHKMMLAPTAKTITDLQAEIDADVTAHAGNSDAHHNESHSIVSHDTTVTGAELNADHSKLAGIDTGAKDDQTGAEIKTAYESEADTNAFTDAEKTKLGTVDTDADVTGSNAPQVHQASHNSGGGDQLRIDNLQEGEDNTDLNSSTSRHGLLKKLDNSATNFMNGQGVWAVPAGGEGTVNIFMPVEAAYLPADDPAELVEVLGATVYSGYSYLAFDDSADEHAIWRVPMPDYDGGNITFKFYWVATETSGNVAWNIESIGVADGESLLTAVVTDAVEVTADTVTGTTLDLNITTHSTYNPASVASDDIMVIEITRDISRDDMAADARLLGILIEYMRT